jgi:hypothetical protein
VELTLHDPADMVMVGDGIVVGHFVPDPQQNDCGTGNANRQTRDIEDAETFIFPEVSNGGRQIIAEHTLNVLLNGNQEDASYTPGSVSTLYPARTAPACSKADNRCPLSKKSLFYIR